MKNFITILVVASVSVLPTASQERAAVQGAAAPPLAIHKWIYGEPITAYTPGRVYLVEFTHTQCAPCREAIPHLNVLANRYPKQLTVVSVYSYFKTDTKTEDFYTNEIRLLKQRMGKDMEYTIAMDSRDGKMNENWRGEQNGFPYAFLIDQQGVLIWHGGVDMTLIDGIVEDVITGRKDAASEAIRRSQSYVAASRKISTQLPRASKVSLVTALDSLMVIYPERESHLSFLKIRALLRHDQQEANAFLGETLKRLPDFGFDPEAMFLFGRYPGLDWELGVELFRRCIAGSKAPVKRARHRFNLSLGYALNGMYEVAANTVKTAIIDLTDADILNDSRLNEYHGWLKAYEYCSMCKNNPVDAIKWLNQQVLQQLLSVHAAKALYYRLNNKLNEEQLSMLKRYIETKPTLGVGRL